MAGLRRLINLAVLVLYTGNVAVADVSRAPASASASGFLSSVAVSPDNAVIFEGQDVSFNCTYLDSIGPNIKWLRNGEELTEVETTPFLMGGSVTLEEVDISWNDSQITCLADGNNASALLIVLSGAPTIITPPTNQTVRLGDTFSLVCEVQGYPPPTVTWYQDGLLLDPSFLSGVEYSNNRLTFDQASDDFIGQYTCVAINVHERVVSDPASVMVMFPPTFSNTPQSNELENGSNIVLPCQARGYPTPAITWTHNNTSLMSTTRIQIQPKGDLHICDVKLTDAGLYQCSASNELGTILSDQAMLIVWVRPVFRFPPEDTTVDLGSPAMIRCVVFALPAPTYAWMHEGQLVLEDSRIEIVSGSLFFSEVRLEDGGRYRCLVENTRGQIESFPATLTINAPPPPPDTPDVISTGPTWLEVRWSPVTANPPVLRYHIEYKLSFHGNWTLVTEGQSMKYNITGLYPSALYHVRVRAESPLGEGESSDIAMAMTQHGVPPPDLQHTLTDVTITSSGSRNLTIEWTTPPILLQTSYVSTRVVLVHPLEQGVQLNSSTSPIVVPGLYPASQYSFEVAIVFAGGFIGSPVEVNGTTQEDVPDDAPTVTVTGSTSHSILLTWLPPSSPNGVIQSYTTRYFPVGSPNMEMHVTGTARMVELMELLAYTNYSISVSARTLAGEGPAAEVIAMTEEDVPEVAPSGLTVTPLSPTSIRLSWEPLDRKEVPGVLTEYNIRYNREHHGGHPETVTVKADATSVVIKDLHPFTVYHVMVAGATEVGVGTFSGPARAMTQGTVPEAVIVITALDPTGPNSLLVTWAEPNPAELHASPDSITYVIRHSDMDVGSGGFDEAAVELIVLAQELEERLNYSIEGLQPFTTYSVAMAVRNDHGTGPFGMASMATTDDSVPTVAPSGLNLVPMSSSSLQLSWQPLNATNVPGTLVNYTINYTNGDQQFIAATFPNITQVLLEDLQSYTEYHVMVAGATSAGVGLFSGAVTARTLEGIPDVVLTVTSVVPTCPPSSLIVEWVEPGDFTELLNGPVNSTLYVFSYQGDGGEVVVSREELGGNTRYTIEGLVHNTSYSVSVAVRNNVDTGNFSQPVENSTLEEGVPSDPPQGITPSPISPHTITVTWTPPTMPNGQPSYTVRYLESARVGQEEWEEVERDVGETNATLDGLKVFTNYSIQVRAVTSCGEGPYSSTSEATTLQAPPSPPVGVAVGVVTPYSLVVTWKVPEEPNGIIDMYKVYCHGDNVSIPSESRSHECTGLEPETNYNVTVAAVNGAGEGERETVTAETACEASPPTVRISGGRVFVMTVAEECSVTPTYVLVVVQELTTKADGTYERPMRSLESYSIEELKRLTGQFSNSRRKRQNNREAVYIAANVSADELEGGNFQLGDDQMYGGYQNHVLKPDVFYNVGVMSKVAGSEMALWSVMDEPFEFHSLLPSPTPPPTPSEEDSTDFPLIIVVSAGAGGLLVVAIIFVILIICCCCCCSRSLDGKGTPMLERGGSFRLSRRGRLVDPVEEFRATHSSELLETHPPVPIIGFVNKLLVMRTNDNQLFLEEFGSIDMNPRFSCDVATTPYNMPKNRYNNIIAFDQSRVKLSSIRGQQGSDYINANYISGYMKPKAYIATQGPLLETLPDFWRMIWEDNVRTLVMLTNTTERGKTKCEMYWPRELGSGAVYGNIEVTLREFTQLADFTIRSFAVQKVGSGKEPREVRQFHFTSWPDHGVPQYATAMLSLLRRVRAYHMPEFGPMLVHCSAGVGRSGTFIVINSMLDRMNSSRESTVDIYGHVSLLRTQRNYMVQTEDQYFFIYEAIAEAIVCGNTELSLEQLQDYVADLYQVIPDDEQDTTYIELQFKRLAVDKNDPHRFASANKDANKSKNRYVNVLPYEINRVILEYIRGVDGSDYINANHIDSYHNQRAFIATQGPQPHTVTDFWRMVWQYNSPIVVMLTQLVEKGMERCAKYWPHETHQQQTYGSFSVEMTVERNSGNYVYRDLHIIDPDSGQNRLVHHFQFLSWPEVGVPASTLVLVEFLREVQKLYASLNTKAPLIIHCSNGIGRTGVFIALHIILERMVTEGLVDVFQTVKNLRIQRPAMVQTLEQYRFCYDAAVDYLESSAELAMLQQQQQQQQQQQHHHTRTGSNTSDIRRKSRNASPARSESFRSKRSSRNLEQSQFGNGGAHIIGESDATSTFGTQHHDGASPHLHNDSSSPSGSTFGVQHNNSSPRLSALAGSDLPVGMKRNSSSPRVSAIMMGYETNGGNSSPRGSLHAGSQSQLATVATVAMGNEQSYGGAELQYLATLPVSSRSGEA